MSSKWRKFRLEEQCERVTKGTTPTTVGGRFTESGINFIKVESIGNDGQIQEDKLAAIDTETDELLKRSRILSGDILFTIAGTIGRVSLFPEKLLPANTNQAVAIIRLENNSEIDRTYLYYALRSEVTKNTVAAGVVQAVQANFSLGSIKKLEIQAPSSIDEQRKIAKNLKALDDKIQLNHQINQTLEQMAQAIFKSWFVDFEPVKAKIAALDAGGTEADALLAAMQVISGKDADQLTQMQAEQPEQYTELRGTAELFPSAMQDSELGEIPEGWVAGELSDLADLNKRSWSKKTIPDELIYIDLSNTKNGTIESTTRYTSIGAPSRARRRLEDGDTIIGTVRPGNKSFAFIKNPEDILTASTGFAVLSPKQATFAEFVYVSSTSEDSIAHLAHLADGGAYPAVRPETVAGLACVIPALGILEAYSRAVTCFFSQRHQLQQENSCLADMRDTLLPKLLSGELTLPDTEVAQAEPQDVANAAV